MTVIEMQTMQIIKSYLPQIAGSLTRIANELESKLTDEPTHTCCICGKKFKGHGNNPHPVEIEGVCCDKCNTTVVLERIKQLDKEVNNG